MSPCPYENQLDQWMDGVAADPAAVEAHVAECPSCAEYAAFLQSIRGATEATPRPAIEDAQFRAFAEGIRSGVADQPQESWMRRALTGLSIAVAALIVAISLYSIFTPAPTPASADTVVESYSTEIEGATTESYFADDGTAVVWVNVPKGDMW